MKKSIIYSLLAFLIILSIQLTRILLGNKDSDLVPVGQVAGSGKALPPKIGEAFVSLKQKDKKFIKQSILGEIKEAEETLAGLPKNTVFVTNLRAIDEDRYSRSLGNKILQLHGKTIYQSDRHRKISWSSVHLPVVRNKNNNKLGIFTGEVVLKYKSKAKFFSWLKKYNLQSLKTFAHLNISSFRLRHNSKFKRIISSLQKNSNIAWFNLDIQFSKEKPF